MGVLLYNFLNLLSFHLLPVSSFDKMTPGVKGTVQKGMKWVRTQAKELYLIEEQVEETLSLKKDRYLDAHRFGNTPYFPFVMGMEYFLRQLKNDFPAVLFSDYSVEAPLIFRRDRDKVVRINHRKVCSNSYQFVLGDLSEASYISSKLEKRHSLRSCDRCQIELSPDFIHRFDKTLYQEVLPHGPHFHNSFDICAMEEDEVRAIQHGFKNTLSYIDDLKCEDLSLNPALLDGLLQLCALHSINFNGKFILPTRVERCFLNLELMKEVDTAYVVCQKRSEAVYDLVVADESGRIFVEMRGMAFSILTRTVPELGLNK